MGKKAFVFIIDGSPSMNAPFPASENGPPRPGEAQGSEYLYRPTTRFEAAKLAVQIMTARVIQDASQNEVCTILLKTPETDHPFLELTLEEDDPDEILYPNLTMIDSGGLGTPNFDYLRRLEEARMTCATQEQMDSLQGDCYDGIRLATNTLLRFTGHKPTFNGNRNIVLLTDAENKITMNLQEHLEDIDALRELNVRLTVLGLTPFHGIEQSIEYSDKAPAPPVADGGAKDDGSDNSSQDTTMEDAVEDQSSDGGSETTDEDDPDTVEYDNKDDREKLLLSLTQKTGGKIKSVSTMEELINMDVVSGASKDKGEAKRYTAILQIAPDLRINVKKCSLMAPAKLPTLKRTLASLDWRAIFARAGQAQRPKVWESEDVGAETSTNGGGELLERKESATEMETETVGSKAVAAMDADAKPSPVSSSSQFKPSNGAGFIPDLPFAYNGAGQLMMEDFMKESTVKLVEDSDQHNPISEDNVAKAVQYGADLIKLDDFDYSGLTTATANPILRIACYMERKKIPMECLKGPPVAIVGHDSEQACAALSALAQALDRLDKVAICVFHKSSNVKSLPSLGGLFPFPETDGEHPVRLVFLELPFEGEVIDLNLGELEVEVGDATTDPKTKVCDDLIDSLMLPEGKVESTLIPNPSKKAFKETIVRRAVWEGEQPCVPRSFDSSDPMLTPPEVLERAEPALEAFRRAFRFKEVKVAKKGKKKNDKNRAANFQNYARVNM